MASRPIIYVNRITNLSDARYCAGMGVDMLGFVVTQSHPDYVSPVQFQEIMGWVSGPRRVAEIIDWESVNVEEVISQYSPDLLHISITKATTNKLPSFPLILELSLEIWHFLQSKIQNDATKIEYVFLTEIPKNTDSLNEIEPRNYPLLLPVSENERSILELQNKSGVSGFVLQGSAELKPGLKDYDHLSRILESLDL